MTEHEIAIARDQIRALLAAYNNSGDRGRIDDLIAQFAPGGVLELTEKRLEGREGIRAALTAVATGQAPKVDLRGARHQLTTSRIELLSAEEAQGWSYFFVSRRGTILEEGTYIDRFVRLAEGWRIAHRRVKMHYSVHHQDEGQPG